MVKLANFDLNSSSYSVKLLGLEDEIALQNLYEQCNDFSILSVGKPFSPTEAREEFEIVPDGKTIADKYLLGLFVISASVTEAPFDISQYDLIGTIESIRHYPDDRTWWIGLIMLNPNHRCQGLGSIFYRAFEDWVSTQDAHKVSLGVVEANQIGLKFWKSLGFEMISKSEPIQCGQKIHIQYVMSRPLFN